MDPGEAILRVLRRARKPLTAREITCRMTAAELKALWPYPREDPPLPYPPEGTPIWRTYDYHWQTASRRVSSRLRWMVRDEYVSAAISIEDGPGGGERAVRRYSL